MPVFNHAKAKFVDGTWSWLTTPFKVMLVTDAYVFDADDVNVDAASGAELSGTGYAAGYGGAGRKTLTGKTAAQDGAQAELDADDTVWPGISAGTAAAAVLVVEGGGSDAASFLAAYLGDGNFPIVTNGGELTLRWSADGLLKVT